MSGLLGDAHLFAQESGPAIFLRTFGDRYYSRYETTNGYTVVYDQALGLYCYAERNNVGDLISRGVPLSKQAPAGLPLHLVADRTVAEPNIEQRLNDSFFNRGLETFGANNGFLTGRQVSSGAVRGLTILVNFQDIKTTISTD